MYPVLWTPLINSISNLGFYNTTIDGTNVTFEEGLFGNNASVGGDLVYPIVNTTEMLQNGFSLTLFVKLLPSITVFSYKIGTSVLKLMMVDSMTMSIKCDLSGSGEYETILNMDCHDSVNKWISIAFTYDGNSSMHVYINGNYIASSTDKPFSADTEDSVEFVFSDCNIFNVKIYNGVISMRQIIDDHQCLISGYTFDGSGFADEDMTECDYSGFMNDAKFSSALTLTSTKSPTKQYSVIIPNNVNLMENIVSWSSFFINFWVYPIQTEEKIQTILKYSTDNGVILSVSIRHNEASNPTTVLSIEYIVSETGNPLYHKAIDFSSWHMISLAYNSTGFKAYIDCEKVIDTSDTVEFSGGTFTLCYFDGAYSDFRCFLRTPIEQYIPWLYNNSTCIDDKGTVYSGNLTEEEGKTFSFNNENGFMSESIKIYKEIPDAMIYDSVNKSLTIKDFVEF